MQAVQRSAQKDDGAFARMERGELSTEAFCEPFAREYTDLTGVPLTAEQASICTPVRSAVFVHQYSVVTSQELPYLSSQYKK